MPKKLTQPLVDRLTAQFSGTSEQVIYDSALSGLVLRLRPTGSHVWAVKARLQGRLLTRTIGSTKLVQLNGARKEALKLLQTIRVTKADPKAIADGAKRSTTTLQDLLDRYKEQRRLKPSSVRSLDNVFSHHFGDWLGKPAANITEAMVENRFAKIAEDAAKLSKSRLAHGNRKGDAQAHKASRYLRALLNYAMADNVITSNPVAILRRKRLLRTPKRKSFYLAPSERKKLLISLLDSEGESSSSALSDNCADLVVFLLSTGLRLNEALGLTWDRVSLADQFFTIADTKGGKPLELPMSDTVHAIFKRRNVARKPKQHTVFNSVNVYKSCFPKIAALLGKPVSSHDLRRTFATIAADKVPYPHLQRLLNHASGSVTDGYIVMSVDSLRPSVQAIDKALWEM
jgi:integrase